MVSQRYSFTGTAQEPLRCRLGCLSRQATQSLQFRGHFWHQLAICLHARSGVSRSAQLWPALEVDSYHKVVSGMPSQRDMGYPSASVPSLAVSGHAPLQLVAASPPSQHHPHFQANVPVSNNGWLQ